MRAHCFISTTSKGTQGTRWAWQAADDKGILRRFSERRFVSFNECVDDAYAHGYKHVEVPVLSGGDAAGKAPQSGVTEPIDWEVCAPEGATYSQS